MLTYFELIPIELLEVITYFIGTKSISNFITLFDPKTKDCLLQVKENVYQDIFKDEFPNYHDSFDNLIKYNHKYKWEVIFNEMDKAMPTDVDLCYERSAMKKEDIPDSMFIIEYPFILYEALFYEDYKDMYIKLADYLKDLSNTIAWYYLYAMFNDVYDMEGWYFLTDDSFYIPLLEEFGKISSNDKIFEILSSDKLIFNLFVEKYDDSINILVSSTKCERSTYNDNNTINIEILPIDPDKYTNYTILFKWFIKNFYSYQISFLSKYILNYISICDEEMVKWLLKIYVNMKDRRFDRTIMNFNVSVKYKELIKFYLLIK